MPFSNPTIYSLLFIVIPLLYIPIKWLLSTTRPKDFPPGPPTVLGLGNWHQINPLWHFAQLDAWAKQYGPIMGLKLGPRNVVVLNDASLVYELFVKRATSFSERPPMYIAQNHILPEGRHSYSLFMRNDYANRLRSLAKHTLVGTGLNNLAPLQKVAGTRLVYDLLKNGDDWAENLKPWSLATPVAMMSGSSIQSYIRDFGKKWIDDYNLSQQLWIELLDPTNPPVDLFPILRWVPAMLAEWKRKAPIARKYLLDAYNGLIFQAEKSMKSQGGTFSSMAIIPKLLRQASDTFTNDEGLDMTVFMGGLFDASVGSTLMSFQTLILALAAHPDVQRQAQAEIDSVFGLHRLPDKIELDKLPYVNACVTEAQRWRPLGAYFMSQFGLPRESVADEEIMGYRIPKGSSVVINQWSVHHDPEFYDEPERYNPDRYYQSPVGSKEGASQQGRKPIYTFGVGRKECLGKDYFFQNARIACSLILWAFDIVPDGPLDLNVQTGFTPAVVMMPKPFKVKFVPRRSDDVLLREKEKADVQFTEMLG
nr:cytochrome P450 [Trichoderma crystalligenum]